ncbi:MAG TPA: cation:proton antiporter [Gemmatimonadaceae bacterium]|jgi:NhaP-type Na+/H+ or K+/H+ antiporter|nr:cation:proton antiporter [Gemmatimonadaceae bacterium]
MLEHFPATLALIGIVVLVSSLLSGWVDRTGLPQVAIFLALGLVLGPLGLGLLDLNLQSPALQVIATLALVLVLFSDAIGADIGEARRNRRLALFVLGPGTLLPAALISAAAWLLLGLSMPAALILGAALASTDPVLLRALVRRPDLPADARTALRLESGMNDVVLLPIVALSILALQVRSGAAAPDVGRRLLGLFVLGPALGALIGWSAITLLEQIRRRVGVRRDYESLYALGVAFTAYAAAEGVGGSGFLAAFTAGLMIASLDIELCDCFFDYGEASAEMFLLLTFVAFGASLIWMGLSVFDPRTVLFALLALAMRTIVLLPVLRRAGVSNATRRLIAWFGPRGLSTLLLVLLAVFAGVPGAERLFAIACLVVLLSVVVHGGGIALLLRRRSETVPLPTQSGPRRASLPTLEPSSEAAEAPESQPIPDRITIDELRKLWARHAPVVLVDVRTDRTYRNEQLRARGAMRIPPDDVVRTARAMRLDHHATLVVYCA